MQVSCRVIVKKKRIAKEQGDCLEEHKSKKRPAEKEKESEQAKKM